MGVCLGQQEPAGREWGSRVGQGGSQGRLGPPPDPITRRWCGEVGVEQEVLR